jgi:hypothetical protein
MPKKAHHFHCSGAVVVMLALSGGAAMAQQQPSQAMPQQNASFTDAQLQSYAKAAVQVRKIAQQPEAAKSPQTAQKQQMQAVKSNGLTVQQYNAISAASQENPQIHAKVAMYMKQNGGQ